MAAREAPAAVLGTKLAPWLAEPLGRLERALETRRLGHGWLLTGPPGIGKINLALVFAERLLSGAAERPGELAAGEGVAAYRARHSPADRRPDLHWVFPPEDKQTIGVDQVRDTAELLSLKSFSGSAKVVVIEPAEAMTEAAANALLKTLEEPTPDTYLLLVSHRPGRLPATIRSRCQQLAVSRPRRDVAAGWLGGDAAPAADAAGAALAPFAPLEGSDKDTLNEINELNNTIDMISRGRLDPQAVAQRWIKCDLESILAALTARVQRAIRARFLSAAGSKSVTDQPPDILHNAQDAAALMLLFDRLDAAERLRDLVGRGTNVELAVSVLLSGFKPV